MNRLLNLSKSINLLILVCFFLPFIVIDCEDKSEKNESTADVSKPSKVTVSFDTTSVDSDSTDMESSVSEYQATADSSEIKENCWEHLLRFITQPDGKAHSIAGLFISYWPLLFLGIIPFIFILTFYFQFYKGPRNHILILLVLSLLLLIIVFLKWRAENVRYGYYIISIFNLIMLIVEIFIIKKSTKKVEIIEDK